MPLFVSNPPVGLKMPLFIGLYKEKIGFDIMMTSRKYKYIRYADC